MPQRNPERAGAPLRQSLTLLSPFAVFAVATLLSVVLLAVPTAAAVEIDVPVPLEEPASTDETPPGDQPGIEPLVSEDDWIDPVPATEIPEDDLVAAPEFDFRTLHRSEIFATGMDLVPVVDDPLPSARDRHLRVLQLEETIRLDLVETRQELRALRPQVRVLSREIRHAKDVERRLESDITIRKEAIREFALEAFINEDDMASMLSDEATALLEDREVVDQLRRGHFDDISELEDQLAEERARRARLTVEREIFEQRIVRVQAHRDLRNTQLRSTLELSARTAAGYTQILHDRLTETAVGVDIPLVTLNAYVIAARAMAVERPSCSLEWWMLAGVGSIESHHGTIFDTALDPDGNPSDAIRGPELDGRILEGAEYLQSDAELPEASDRTETIEVAALPEDVVTEAAIETTQAGPGEADGPAESAAPVDGTEAPAPVIKRLALIRDTDDGFYDGDTIYDRAVGPMQFIPQTWRTYGVDANLDEQTDPQNVYDATMASGHYLCVAAGSMATEAGQKVGYFAYNHDEEYSENVLAASHRYRTSFNIPVDPDHTGVTSDLGVFDPPDLDVPDATTPGFVAGLRDLFDDSSRIGRLQP